MEETEGVLSTGHAWLIEAAVQSCGADEERLKQNMLATPVVNGSGVDFILDSGLVKEDEFLGYLASQAGMPWIAEELEPQEPEELKEACPAQLAVQNQVLPLAVVDGALHVACYDPFALEARQLIGRRLELPVVWHVASRRRVREALSSLYGVGAGTFEQILEGRDLDDLNTEDEATVIDEDISDEASVLRFVNNILREALTQKATDIHIEPQHNMLRIRYRVDGHLYDVPIPEHIHRLESSVIARLKIMSRLDVAERRVPQDGRINLSHEGQSVDVRVATIPSIEGETVSLRLLNQEKFDLDALGMEDSVRNVIESLLELTNGVILVTGPTGSGKSTSLYCFLDRLNKTETRIVTIEDPVENKLPGIVQIAVRPEAGLTFAKGLRSILRADPNIVMLGEIRDLETAEIAIRASLTGHLVFSTLHTNSAIGGVSRLVDMGIEPFLVSASVRGLLAQRLVRRLCDHCKQPMDDFDIVKRQSLGIPSDLVGTPYKAVGCPECRHSGYSGRVALYEICRISETIQDIISKGGDENDVRIQALKEGFEGMRTYGWRKVMRGVTTIEEVLSSTHEHSSDASETTLV